MILIGVVAVGAGGNARAIGFCENLKKVKAVLGFSQLTGQIALLESTQKCRVKKGREIRSFVRSVRILKIDGRLLQRFLCGVTLAEVRRPKIPPKRGSCKDLLIRHLKKGVFQKWKPSKRSPSRRCRVKTGTIATRGAKNMYGQRPMSYATTINVRWGRKSFFAKTYTKVSKIEPYWFDGPRLLLLRFTHSVTRGPHQVVTNSFKFIKLSIHPQFKKCYN